MGYNATPPTNKYELAWSTLRFLNRRYWLVFIGYVPVAGGLSYLLFEITKSDILSPILALAWMVYWVYCGIQLGAFVCPRCDCKFFSRPLRLFGMELGYHNAYSGKCLNCGLRKYTYPSDEPH